MIDLQAIHDRMTSALAPLAREMPESARADVTRLLDAIETELIGISPMTSAFVLALAMQRLVGDEIARRAP